MLLETLQGVNLTAETYIEFVQQLELIKKYNQQPNEGEVYNTNKWLLLNGLITWNHIIIYIILEYLKSYNSEQIISIRQE